MQRFLVFILAFLLTACSGEPLATIAVTQRVTVTSRSQGSTSTPASVASLPTSTLPLTATPTVFRLPSLTPTLTFTPMMAPPSATPDCQDGLTFLSDITVPDGAVVSQGEKIDKRWQVQNSGTCNWGPGYQMRRISGEELGTHSPQALFPARSGTQAVIQIIFTAPGAPGSYRSAWQAYNPDGEPFGDLIFVDFIVAGSP